jgi:hypothetical protein
MVTLNEFIRLKKEKLNKQKKRLEGEIKKLTVDPENKIKLESLEIKLGCVNKILKNL